MSFKSLYNFFVSQKEASWILKPESAMKLYRFVKNNDVKNVLDLGTGIGLSAAIISLASKEKGIECHIDTVEQTEKCFKLSQELIPEELKANISFHRIDPVLFEIPEIPGHHFSKFKELPNSGEGFDFLLTDGPGPWLNESSHLIDVPNADVLILHKEGKIKAGTKIYFDGRVRALAILERFCEKNFYLIEEPNRENILERKDNPVIFEDKLKKELGMMGYFSP